MVSNCTYLLLKVAAPGECFFINWLTIRVDVKAVFGCFHGSTIIVKPKRSYISFRVEIFSVNIDVEPSPIITYRCDAGCMKTQHMNKLSVKNSFPLKKKSIRCFVRCNLLPIHKYCIYH